MQQQAHLITIKDAPGRPTSGGGYLTFFARQEGGFHCGTFTLPPGVRLGRKAMAHSGPEVYFRRGSRRFLDLRSVAMRGA